MIHGIGFLAALILLLLVSRNQVRISYSDWSSPARLAVSSKFLLSLLGVDWKMEAGKKQLSLQIFRWHLQIGHREKVKKQIPSKKIEKVKKKKSKFTWAGSWRWVQILKVPLPRLVRRLLHCSKNPRLHGEIEFGLSNPAETGKLLGVILAFQNALVYEQHVNLRFYPDFQKSTWRSNIHFSFDFRPYQILIAITIFLIRTGWQYHKTR